jgi:DNA-directed RNA polymerase subunit RPC12/RpoP
MDETPEKPCEKCGAKLVLKPVPGAKSFPRRLECPTHGWEKETMRAIRMRFHKDRPDW